MADWRGVQAGLQSGYEIGRSTGGKLSALGQSIAKLADSFRQQREAGEQTQAGILGEVAKARIGQALDPEKRLKAAISAKIEAGQSLSPEEKKMIYGYTPSEPGEWKPKTGNEAMAFERAKAGLKPKTQLIVDSMGNVVGSRPAGSVYQPQESQTDAILAALGGGEQPIAPRKLSPITAVKPTAERILVVSPDGKEGTIPASQLQEALKGGYKRKLK